MAQKKPVVEIIPWVHSVEYQAHADVVEYIKKLPKNSYLALEVKPSELVIIGKAEDFLIGRSPSLRGLGRKKKGASWVLGEPGLANFIVQSPTFLAIREVLHECKKRNIAIFPLETPVSASVYSDFNFDNLLKMKKSEAGIRFREETHARQIQFRLMKFSEEKLPVLVGGFHAFELKTRLEKLGIAATVNTSLFTYRHLVEKRLQSFVELRRAMSAGKLRRAESIASVFCRSQEPIRAKSLNTIVTKLVEKLRAKAARPARKLAERKQKPVARLARQQRRK